MTTLPDFLEKIKQKMFLPEIAVYSAVFGVVTAGIILARSNQTAFTDGYVIEDGPVEWLTVAALLCCAGLCFSRAVRGFKAGARLFSLVWFLGAAACVFGTGEELAWGQRLFGYETPRFFLEHNSKLEPSIHCLMVEAGGIDVIYTAFDTGLGIAVFVYLFIFPPLYRNRNGLKAFIDRLAIPVPRKRHSAAFALLYLWILLSGPGRGEVVEFAACWQFFLIMLYPENWSGIGSGAGIR
ncbi:MAG TPA: hypothetical protein PKI19_05790 [Elusimicrobiales bacterium]|nr:hypothetical protein [Elusimicrobiales bacterium]